MDQAALPRLLTATEAAHYLGIGRSTLYELKKRGELPHVLVGTIVRFDVRDLDAYVEARKEAPPGALPSDGT